MIAGDDVSSQLRENPWAVKFVNDFAMFKAGGYLPWVHEPETTPRRRTIQAFRVLSQFWLTAEPAMIAHYIAVAFGGTPVG